MDENKQETAEKIVSEMMLGKDAFSLWMGIELLEIKPGYCRLKCLVRQDMLNGFHIAHGGITYSFADSALAFASNAHNIKAVSVETNISHVKKVVAGDILTAECSEKNLTSKFGIYGGCRKEPK
jgi:acyl-CoA thioesterase